MFSNWPIDSDSVSMYTFCTILKVLPGCKCCLTHHLQAGPLLFVLCVTHEGFQSTLTWWQLKPAIKSTTLCTERFAHYTSKIPLIAMFVCREHTIAILLITSKFSILHDWELNTLSFRKSPRVMYPQSQSVTAITTCHSESFSLRDIKNLIRKQTISMLPRVEKPVRRPIVPQTRLVRATSI